MIFNRECKPTAAPVECPDQKRPAVNLQFLLSWRRLWWQLGSAVAAGLLLSAAFPPLEWDFLAWFALAPLLLTPLPVRWSRALLIGAAFGLSHFVTLLTWLNTIGFFAGVWLGMWCSLFAMAWYLFVVAVQRRLALWQRKHDHQAYPAARLLISGRLPEQAVLVVVYAAAWVSLEWLRSWLFTGFPWGFVGISQWQRLGLLQLTTVTGVYGLSYVIVSVNVALAAMLPWWWQRWRRRGAQQQQQQQRGALAWPLLMAALPMPLILALALRPSPLGEPATTLRVLAVQGHLEQMRIYSPEQLTEALQVYSTLTRQGVRLTRPELVLWPETAVPAPVRWEPQYHAMMRELFTSIDSWLLLGSIDYRPVPGNDDDYLVYNSAMLFDGHGQLREIYDKVQRVPFGEYTPFARYMPWLEDWIGMGRALSPGHDYTLLNLPKHVLAGPLICYEDVYARISRAFVVRGANVLFVLTNDAWYAESAGSRQHMIHAVFRAVETRRPLIRAGNNSDTCLILPDGRIVDPLLDGSNRFVRMAGSYEVPVWIDPPHTWYTRYGDVFAYACTALTLLLLALLGRARIADGKALAAALTAEA